MSVEGDQDPANRCIGSSLNTKSTVETPMGSTVGHVAQHCLLTQVTNKNTNKEPHQQTTTQQLFSVLVIKRKREKIYNAQYRTET